MFILIEGGDASGKTTIINEIKQRLSENKIEPLTPDNTIILKSPTSPFSEIWRTIDKTAHIDSLTRFYFFRATAQNDSAVVKNFMQKDKHVILERYIYSTAAFNETFDKYSKVDDPALLSKNHLSYQGLLKPDIAFLLDLPDEVRNHRIFDRAKVNKSVSWWERPDFQHDLNCRLRELAQNEGMSCIDTSRYSSSQAVDIIAQKIAIFERNRQLSSIIQGLKSFKESTNY